MRIRRLLLVALFVLISRSVVAAGDSADVGTVQLKSAKETIEGRVVARDDQRCWLFDRAGRLREVRLSEVKSFKQISTKFAASSPMAMASDLIRELGKDYETATSRHYVVACPKGKAKTYVELFESVYRNFHMHFSVRGFHLNEPEFPLVAIVFPSRAAFLEYAKREGTNATQFGGYYSPRSNRAALFEVESSATSQLDHDGSVLLPLNREPASDFSSPFLKSPNNVLGAPRAFKTIDADQRDTMIHECTHQVAYNVGMHERVGENARWIVEGLATVFEAPGIRNSSAGSQLSSRVNPERLAAFKDYLKRRPKNSLESTVGGDELFQQAMQDFYAEAWALSFYLVETRPRKYSNLLQRSAERDGSKKLTREERLEMFRASIGDNFKMLDAEFVRFYEKLK